MTGFTPGPPVLPGEAVRPERPHRRFLTPGLFLRLAILFSGPLLLAVAGVYEFYQVARTPWGYALIVLDADEPLWDGMVPVTSRRLPPENFADGWVAQFLQDDPDVIDLFGLNLHERVIAMPDDAVDWSRVLASGRPPQPGAREVVAGPLVRLDRFTLEEESFDVVGQLHRGVSGFSFAYALPAHRDLDSVMDGGQQGWFDPQGIERLFELNDLSEFGNLEFVGGASLVPRGFALINIFGMFLAAFGGVLVWTHLFRYLGERLRPAWLAEPFQLIQKHPGLFWGIHGALYGLFFLAMLVAMRTPVGNLRLSEYAQNQFAEGGLQFVGDAYLSGHILHAAFATWVWNFLVATVLYGFAPSLLIPWAGVLKNILSFTFVGYVMAPLWVGTGSTMVYHSGTLVLELEPYVLASFYIALYPIYMVRGIVAGLRDHDWRDALRALRIMAVGAAVVGVFLAIAALYEAITLITLHGF